MSTPQQKIVTRFAPSPTGFMHVGGVRTALFAYLWAKKNNGEFILRIEDTDKEREVEGAIAHIMESLKWLGINWDYGPDRNNPFGSAIQSERLPTYIEVANKLVAKGMAYPDPYNALEVEAFRKAAMEQKRPFLFRDHRPEHPGTWDGKMPLRFRVPNIRRMRWHDAVRGELEAGEEALDDFILIKSDGYPTYNLAHIVDDMHMGVTHIMRADEFISSTPKFLALYEALDITPPVLVTLPPILREDRTKKLGKRDGAKDILEYRTDGYLPDAMVNFLALTGWNPGGEEEVFTPSELIERFDISGIQRAGALLNEEKLNWINKEHVKRLSEEARLSYLRAFTPTSLKALPTFEERLPRVAPLILERLGHFAELKTMHEGGELAYFFSDPEYEKEKLFWKGEAQKDDLLRRLGHLTELITNIPESLPFSATTVKDAIFPFADTEGRGQVLWPMRVALSGKERSPDPFQLAEIFGKEETLRRIKHAIALFDKNEK